MLLDMKDARPFSESEGPMGGDAEWMRRETLSDIEFKRETTGKPQNGLLSPAPRSRHSTVFDASLRTTFSTI